MIKNAGAEVLTGLSILMGWALLTYTAASLVSMWAYPVSVGLLLLGLAGFRLIATILWEGLYSLSRDDEEEGEQ